MILVFTEFSHFGEFCDFTEHCDFDEFCDFGDFGYYQTVILPMAHLTSNPCDGSKTSQFNLV